MYVMCIMLMEDLSHLDSTKLLKTKLKMLCRNNIRTPKFHALTNKSASIINIFLWST